MGALVEVARPRPGHPGASMRRPGARVLLSSLLLTLHAADVDALATVTSARSALIARFGIAEGLSQSTVTALVQDRRGFLWVGTLDGLNRFDGHEFRVHRADRSDPHGLPDAAIRTLASHADGSVWAGTTGGYLSRYDPVTGRFTTVPQPGIAAVVVDREGAVWVGSAGGLWYAAPDEAPQMRFTRIEDRAVTALAARAQGGVWIGGADASVRMRASTREDTVEVASVQLEPGPIRALTETANGELWVAADGPRFLRVDALGRPAGVYVVPANGTLDEPRIRAVVVDGDGHVWLGGLAMGVVRFDPVEGEFVAIRHRPFDPRSLAHDDVASLWSAAEGALWIGTMSGGLNRLRLERGGIAHVRHQPDEPASLSHNVVTAFTHDDDGAIWVGTDGGGLNRLAGGSQHFERVPLVAEPSARRGLARIWALHADRDGGLWVGTWGSGLWHRPRGSRTFVPVRGASSGVVNAIHEEDAVLWIATQRGLLRYSGSRVEPVAMLGSLNLTAIESAGDGRLWIATWDSGLLRFDPRTGELETYRPADGDERSLRHWSVRALAVSGQGVLWAGTGAGLARWDPRTREFQNLGEAEGLPPGAVYGLELEDDDSLWLSTNAGLARLSLSTGTVRRFGPDEGAQDFEFNGGAHHRLPDGRLLFGGVNGFNVVDPRSLPAPIRPRPAQIVEILLDNRPAMPAAIDGDSPLEVTATELETLTLPARFNVIGIRFAAPLPMATRQIRYAYRLDPFDDEWRSTGPERPTAVYTRLPAGEYRFRVRAGSDDGGWSESERAFVLNVLPQWWASGWAYFVYFAAAMAALVGFIRWRTRLLRARAVLLERRVRERTGELARQTQLVESQASQLRSVLEEKENFFARVSHEFRTPLTLILGPIDALLEEERSARSAGPLRVVRRNASRLLRLVDQLLGMARVSGQVPLEPASLPLAPFVGEVLAAFETPAASKGVQLSIARLDDVSVYATTELLERIVANLVSNAVKYTPAGGHVRITVRDEGAMAAIVVADDGPGIPVEAQDAIFEPFRRLAADGTGSGIGLAIVRESAEALGGAVRLESSPGAGATFTVRLRAAAHHAAEARGSSVRESVPSERLRLEADVVDGAPAPCPDALGSVAPMRGSRGGDTDLPRVLIVEDNDDLRAFLVSTLQRDHCCTSVDAGRRGVAMAIDDPPDLVLSDVMMPDVDGFELTRTLKQDPRTSHVPIILITALGDRESRIHGLEDRADDYVVKPFDLDELRLRVRNVIDGRRIAGQRAASGVYDSARPLADTGAVDAMAHGPRERDFLEKLRSATAHGHPDPAFGVPQMAAAVAMSERQLQRKLRALLDVSPAEYLREYRLQQAVVRLRAGEPAGNVAFDVGFTTPSHFGACFKARFGMTPGEFAHR